MSPRDRKKENEDLTDYPGLGRYKDGRYFVEHPVSRRQASLKTRDRATAVRRWLAVREAWDAEAGDKVADRIAERLGGLGSTDAPATLADLLRDWRENELERDLVIARRGARKGQPVSEASKRDYRADCLQLEKLPEAAKLKLNSPRIVEQTRRIMSPWLNQPTHYNGLRNTLSRVYAWAISRGDLSRNPIREIEKAVEHGRRTIYIPDDIYIAITQELATHTHFNREHDGEWRARICDLMYMLSQQPIDVFGIQELQIDDEPFVGEDGIRYLGSISIKRSKTAEGVVIGMNQDLRDTVDWFRAWKKAQALISPYLLIYPRYMGKRARGKPVTHRQMSAWWLEARRAAQKRLGFDTEYRLQDLRRRGLTDEAKTAGKATDKGAHATDAMRNYYVVDRPPKRHGNTLGRIR